MSISVSADNVPKPPSPPPSLLAAINPDLPVHGVQYPPGFLESLQLIHDRPAPFAPIRAINGDQLAMLRHISAMSDVPDSVLFPYLHGLDGDNEAQKQFFAQDAMISRGPNSAHVTSMLVPRYRGLVCVAVEEREKESDWIDEDDDSLMEDSDDEFYDEDDAMSDDAPGHDSDNSTPPDSDAVPSLDHSREASEESSTSASSSPNTDSPPASVFGQSLPSPTGNLGPDGQKLIPGSISRGATTTFTSAITPLLTSSFRAANLLFDPTSDHPEFIDPGVPDGISLRNFGIQVGKYVTLADIIVYSAGGLTNSAINAAKRFKHAIEKKAADRHQRWPNVPLVAYNVFVVTDPFHVIEEKYPHLVAVDHRGLVKHKVDFIAREKEEMRNLTKASEISPHVWLGNTMDAPMPFRATSADPFDPTGNDGLCDICIECHEGVPFPSSSHIRQAEEHLRNLDERWVQHTTATSSPGRKRMSSPPLSPKSPVSPTTSAILELSELHFTRSKSGPPTPLNLSGSTSPSDTPRVCRREPSPKPRPPPNPMSAIHLLFPSSPPSNQTTLVQLMPFLEFLERAINPEWMPSPRYGTTRPSASGSKGHFRPSRPLKVLIYSADGYTESSFLALCWLMHHLELSLPEAYLELQVEKHRSFFVYTNELGVLRRIEAKMVEERAHEAAATAAAASEEQPTIPSPTPREVSVTSSSSGSAGGKKWRLSGQWRTRSQSSAAPVPSIALMSSSAPNTPLDADLFMMPKPKTAKRARASTSPSLPGFPDHQIWFDDPRFDGSFPSRVLPFLYLGNLNHASNAFMLHALGITHVVSVGECALVPPTGHGENGTGFNLVCPVTHSLAGRGSLWMEEREGRIKVLDIKGVCDDGIDSLRPQIRPIVEWIDKARDEGGKVLVHCRVGVSRSATVTIAYVMKHLKCSLVEAYLMVRSRRLSVLIQPNMRLLYNLCGWEVELAQDEIRENNMPETHGMESRLSWPYLAKEVHTLNERYLS
ncbi:hypothetical protein DACRYDRAFT_93238 [Dacryopinax primogenitus]|uniref:Uncharacterized protein n=1 Tax=Dacryopinax primogenitus (strain DJM 731) TaxID=1858805 RepID=M5G7U5_DACPD|nr:uncharacterized protein DACRYDRAFT_93238 [Dacryopinax primogenitus]EJU04824.1 hypothetical protein DACRYDRAFT_93238 [Dacryopinax primogenitus]